eukprot:3512985-Amphidinium_carterae.1
MLETAAESKFPANANHEPAYGRTRWLPIICTYEQVIHNSSQLLKAVHIYWPIRANTINTY